MMHQIKSQTYNLFSILPHVKSIFFVILHIMFIFTNINLSVRVYMIKITLISATELKFDETQSSPTHKKQQQDKN